MQETLYYYPYSLYLKKKYGEKVYKLPVNLPVSCPNRKVGNKGCTFCAGAGAGFESLDCYIPVAEQIELTKQRIREKYHAYKYIAYFQNYTNTFLPLEQFRAYIKEAASCTDIAEIAVSTRPDCIRGDYLHVLDEIRREYGVQITIELGLQTANYHTLLSVNRGHTLAEFIDSVLKIRPYGFDICTHVILNLPGDRITDAIETAKLLSALQIQTVKAHSLYIAKNTRLCDAWENGTITLCSKEEYFRRLKAFLEYLSPDIAVERLFGRIPKEDSVFCNWGTSWWKLRDEFLSIMERTQSRQGIRCCYLNGAALKHMDPGQGRT